MQLVSIPKELFSETLKACGLGDREGKISTVVLRTAKGPVEIPFRLSCLSPNGDPARGIIGVAEDEAFNACVALWTGFPMESGTNPIVLLTVWPVNSTRHRPAVELVSWGVEVCDPTLSRIVSTFQRRGHEMAREAGAEVICGCVHQHM